MRGVNLFSDEAAIGQVLGEFCSNVEIRTGLVYAVPRNSVFSELFVYSQPVGFGFERKYAFAGRLVIVPEESMSEDNARLYRTLKQFECELVYRGILRRKPFFRVRERLRTLSKYVRGLEPRDDLASLLNGNPELLEMIRAVDAVDVVVALKFLGAEIDAGVGEVSDPRLAAEVAYFENPMDVVWEPVVSVMLVRGPQFRPKVLKTVNVLENIGKILLDFSKRVGQTYI